MKFIFILLFTSTINLFSQKAQIDTLINIIVKSFQTQDISEFNKLTYNLNNFRNLYIYQYDNIDSIKIREKRFKSMKNFVNTKLEKYNQEFINYFTDCIKDGELRGIKWNEVQLVDYNIIYPFEEKSYIGGKIILKTNRYKFIIGFSQAEFDKKKWYYPKIYKAIIIADYNIVSKCKKNKNIFIDYCLDILPVISKGYPFSNTGTKYTNSDYIELCNCIFNDIIENEALNCIEYTNPKQKNTWNIPVELIIPCIK